MTTAVSTRTDLPTDARTGLILPLSKSLGSQALAAHRAMVALELEVMAKKLDRFGWERDRGTAAHDRIITDWMDALHDYPLDEVQQACRLWVRDNPRRMANEGDILGKLRVIRREKAEIRMRNAPPEPPRQSERVSPERASEILAAAGFAPRRFPGGAAE